MNFAHRFFLALSIAQLVPSSAHAQAMEKWGYPEPDVIANAVQSLCNEQTMSILLAARYRDQGRQKREVLALIPDNPPDLGLRTIDAYRENVEDVFDYPKLGTYTVLVFRAEQCRREIMSARTFGRLSTVYGKLTACEAVHGQAKSDELYACIRKVVTGM